MTAPGKPLDLDGMEGVAFLTDGETVFWSTAYGPARLDERSVNALLDLFEQMDGPAVRKLWLDLYDAASRTEGFIPRVTSHRAEHAPKPGPRLVGADVTTTPQRRA